ncbi:MAG: glycogen/starch/alpha-glucan phosphorylase [Deltaproteobacteria bacterium]|nr:glycogen/starch/alpha-glucan phosphorylase [Deltaproteobacteria bacterium]
MDKESIKRSFADHIEYTQGKDRFSVTQLDFYLATAYAARERLLDRFNVTRRSDYQRDARRVYYLSLEFLIGRLLEDGLRNLGIHEETRRALADLGLDMDSVAAKEGDAGLGNGGLGRLAACFLDSMATLDIPAVGYGIRYEYGIFRQIIDPSGAQVEAPDTWLRHGNPWELERSEKAYRVQFHGHVRSRVDDAGRTSFEWVDTRDVIAVAHDVLVPGYRNERVNVLRLWAAQGSDAFDFEDFNRGDYVAAVQHKNATEDISRVLYPSDKVRQGRELRLKQEYFFVAATIRDAVVRHLKAHPSLHDFGEYSVFQLNDTHPAIAVAELMRVLLDEHRFDWDDAWRVTTSSLAYTNHTVLPEALEQWPVWLMEEVLPRHMQIIYEVNRRFLDQVRHRWPGDEDRVRRMSLIEEGGERRVRMANLAIVGSYSVNGVSALHTKILTDRIFRDFYELEPGKFNNKTNGVTPRRWLMGCNPGLSALVTSRIGDGWTHDLARLDQLAQHADDPELHASWQSAKRRNKERLAAIIARECNVTVDPTSIFDVQIKRIHEYKRQHLNILHVLSLYQRYKQHIPADTVPRTFIFGGKAAPGYDMAKRIIRLVHAVARVVNDDPAVNAVLKVVYIPNYNVSLAERIIPAAEVSEQISTAGMEASGTGNMKFAMNGALTIGTLDGANVEIREAVGPENFFLFGLTDLEVQALKKQYDPAGYYHRDPEIHAALDAVASGWLSPDEPGRFRPIVDSLLYGDPFMVLADFHAYRDCHERLMAAYRDREGWTRKSILNTARSGRFSSDRTIMDYAREVWRVGASPASPPKGT